MRKNLRLFFCGVILFIIIFVLFGIIFFLLIPQEHRKIEAYISYSAAGVSASLIASLVFYFAMKFSGSDTIENLESKYEVLLKTKELGVTNLFSSVEAVPNGAAQFYKNILECEPKEFCLLGVSNYKWFGDPGRGGFRDALIKAISESKVRVKVLFLDPESKFLSHEILRDKKVKIESTKDILKKIKEESNDIVELNGMRRKDDEGLQIKKYDSLPSLHIIKCEGLKRLYVYHYCRPSIKDEQSPLLIEINKEVSPKMYETYNCHFDYVWKESAFFD